MPHPEPAAARASGMLACGRLSRPHNKDAARVGFNLKDEAKSRLQEFKGMPVKISLGLIVTSRLYSPIYIYSSYLLEYIRFTNIIKHKKYI